MELENDIITIIIVFDVVTKKIVLLDALIKQLVRRNWPVYIAQLSYLMTIGLLKVITLV